MVEKRLMAIEIPKPRFRPRRGGIRRLTTLSDMLKVRFRRRNPQAKICDGVFYPERDSASKIGKKRGMRNAIYCWVGFPPIADIERVRFWATDRMSAFGLKG